MLPLAQSLPAISSLCAYHNYWENADKLLPFKILHINYCWIFDESRKPIAFFLSGKMNSSALHVWICNQWSGPAVWTGDLYLLLYVRIGAIRHQREKPSNQIPTARSQHLFSNLPKLFGDDVFIYASRKNGDRGLPRSILFARTCNCIHGRDRWDPMRPLFPFPGHTKGAGRSIPFLWCVARQAGTPVICSTTQPYSSASNQTLTGKGVWPGVKQIVAPDG